jgi:hypothetical protein
LHLTVGETVLNDDILANAITETSQAVFESLNRMKLRLLGPTREVAYPVDPPSWLLSARRHRQRSRAAEQRDEVAALHF